MIQFLCFKIYTNTQWKNCLGDVAKIFNPENVVYTISSQILPNPASTYLESVSCLGIPYIGAMRGILDRADSIGAAPGGQGERPGGQSAFRLRHPSDRHPADAHPRGAAPGGHPLCPPCNPADKDTMINTRSNEIPVFQFPTFGRSSKYRPCFKSEHNKTGILQGDGSFPKAVLIIDSSPPYAVAVPAAYGASRSSSKNAGHCFFFFGRLRRPDPAASSPLP